jgi:hypothetical protein
VFHSEVCCIFGGVTRLQLAPPSCERASEFSLSAPLNALAYFIPARKRPVARKSQRSLCSGPSAADRRASQGRGITMMDLFCHVPVPPVARYFAVKVLLPAVSPVTRYVALT